MKYEFIGQSIRTHEAETEAEKLAAKVYDLHGSGLNFTFEFYKKGNVLRLDTHYDFMNENGYYTGIIPVTAWFNIEKKELISVRCRNTGKYPGMRDCLEDVFLTIKKEMKMTDAKMKLARKIARKLTGAGVGAGYEDNLRFTLIALSDVIGKRYRFIRRILGYTPRNRHF